MSICYRDNIGIVTIKIDMTENPGIVFDGRSAYFTDASGNDCKVDIVNIISIGNE